MQVRYNSAWCSSHAFVFQVQCQLHPSTPRSKCLFSLSRGLVTVFLTETLSTVHEKRILQILMCVFVSLSSQPQDFKHTQSFMLWEAGLPLKEQSPVWFGANTGFRIVLDSERALDLPIRANFNLFPPPLLPDGWCQANLQGFLLSCFAVYSPCSLMSPALMGLSTVSRYSAPPWWSDVEPPLALF